jgi:hypothetical protein
MKYSIGKAPAAAAVKKPRAQGKAKAKARCKAAVKRAGRKKTNARNRKAEKLEGEGKVKTDKLKAAGVNIKSSMAMGSGEQDVAEDPQQVLDELNVHIVKHPTAKLTGHQVNKGFKYLAVLENVEHSVRLMRVNLDLIV